MRRKKTNTMRRNDRTKYTEKVGVLSKGLNGLIWFLARMLLSTSPTL